ncbi:MAG: methenyltetrahydromethanopterin cyclohydrolase [Alphaproteobacteria bacterium]|nr:methenyltetrahydromethanopterin cyclohydrolase [Alphaproteobacteria bacterium]
MAKKRDPQPLSVNRRVRPLVDALAADAAALRVGVTRSPAGAQIIDAGIAHPGGLEAGRRIAEICLGGLGVVALGPGGETGAIAVSVHTSAPVVACLGSQYAGWSLQEGPFFAMGSGPGRALARQEELFAELGYVDDAEDATLILEVDKPPPDALIERVAEACGVAAERLSFILTPTTSLAGTVQIVARSLEVALHKTHELKFKLAHVADGFGTAPLPPPSPDFVTAMGRTNDAILYGGRTALYVTGPEKEAEELADALPASASRDYGKPFAEIFAACAGDFYKIDKMLFSPGLVEVTSLESGRCFRRGRSDPALLARSFGLA